MVIGHADCPPILGAFLYEFHMPLFFITAGYFFSLKYLQDEKTFVVKRFKGLYIPFLKWSVFFLLIHNLLFRLNIINGVYGNGAPHGVAHLFTFHELQQYIWTCITEMGGYDVFLTGAFWFFRALLVASILYLVCFKLMDKIPWLKVKDAHLRYNIISISICVLFLLLCLWKTGCNLSVYNLPQGGYRELIGTFFFGIGFLLKQNPRFLKASWWSFLLCFVVVALFSHFAGSSMAWNSSLYKFVCLPIPAVLGFLMVYQLSGVVDKHDNRFRRFMVYCGDHTLPIFIFHTISFKLVSLVKIAYYGLDFRQVGCHMVVHDFSREDLFWIFYTIVGVGVPLLVNYYYLRWKRNVKWFRLPPH